MNRVETIASHTLSESLQKLEGVQNIDVLIVGGGAAGISCALELARNGREILEGPFTTTSELSVLLVESSSQLGGRLNDHNHRLVGITEFFKYAGERSANASLLFAKELFETAQNVEVLLQSRAIAAFSDGIVGIHCDDNDDDDDDDTTEKIKRGKGGKSGRSGYFLVKPKTLVIACGSRDAFQCFKGNTLIGVLFSTSQLLQDNARLLKSKKNIRKKVCIYGSNNEAFVLAAEAARCGAEVVAIISRGPVIAYQVHCDEVQRLGIEILENHRIISACGENERLGSCIVVPNVEEKGCCSDIHLEAREIVTDILCVVDGSVAALELADKAREWGIRTFTCGEADGTSDVTSCVLSGRRVAAAVMNLNSLAEKIAVDETLVRNNVKLAHTTGFVEYVPPKKGGGRVKFENGDDDNRINGGNNNNNNDNNNNNNKVLSGLQRWKQSTRHDSSVLIPPSNHVVFPVFHDSQKFACNVCQAVCPKNLIVMEGGTPFGIPKFQPQNGECNACGDCVVRCPSQAITLVDMSDSRSFPKVTLACDYRVPIVGKGEIVGKQITILNAKGEILGDFPCVSILKHPSGSSMIIVEVPHNLAMQVAGMRHMDTTSFEQPKELSTRSRQELSIPDIEDMGIVCRCERVTARAIKEAGKRAHNDMNQIKALTRQGMGYCGGYQCTQLTQKILNWEKVGKKRNVRPLNLEISFGSCANADLPPHPSSRVPNLPYEEDLSRNKYDVLVLGAGSIGVPTSMIFAETGRYKVCCLDPNSSPGQGDNKRALGGARATFSNPGKIIVGSESIDVLRNWERNYGDDIEWKDGGYLFVIYTEEHEKSLKSFLPVQHKFGLNVDWICVEKVCELVPGIETSGLRGGIYSPNDGMATPYLTTNAFFKRATQCGAEFKFSNTVVGFLKNNDGKIIGVTSVDKNNKIQKFYGDHVINCLGAKCNELVSTLGFTLPLNVDSHEGGVTRPVPSMKYSPLVIDLRASPGSSNFYFYQNRRKQFVFCVTPDPPIFGYDTNETSEFLPQISKRMTTLVPQFKNVDVRRVWRGLYANTQDGNPLVGFDPRANGLLHAVGMGGQGFMLGIGIAKLLLRIVSNTLNEGDKYVIEEFNPVREMKGEEALR